MSVEAETQHRLNVIFLPFPAPGHMIPMVDTARLFAKHGVSVTIITTPANALTFQKAIDSDFNCGYHIRTRVLPFPAAQVGLPDGLENLKDGTSSPEIFDKVSLGILMIKDQIELLFQELEPDSLVTDMLHPWTVESAAKLGIPRLYYYGSSYFSTCAKYSMRKYKPHNGLVSDTHRFTIPGLPHNVEMTPLQLEDGLRTESSVTEFFDAVYESERRSYGALYNSFHELEGDYEQLYKSTVGKSWSVGPVSAWVYKEDEKKTNRGHKEDLAQESEWLDWLNSKQKESVLYVSFGSLTRLPHSQLVELAHGLEHSGHSFIWVIRKTNESENGDSFLGEFEEKMKESKKGFIIWNWAPQLLILDHPAIGGFLTHCGWNSILESVSAGLPMITWPIFAEQFYNEKLVVDVLKIGVPAGAKENKWAATEEDACVVREEIAKAVVHLMGKEESRDLRRRARKLSDAAKKSIEEGGSSYRNLIQLLDELKSLKITRALDTPFK